MKTGSVRGQEEPVVEVIRKDVGGPNYKQLKPEVKETLDKIVYQLDLVRGTIGLLEQRISQNENKLGGVMDYIKKEDLDYRPNVCKAAVVFDEMDNQQADNVMPIHREHYELAQSLHPKNTDRLTELRARLVEQ